LLTSSWNVTPATITGLNGLAGIEDTILKPLVAMRDIGQVILTDFTTLIDTWNTPFGGQACLYSPGSGVASHKADVVPETRLSASPNPFNPRTEFRIQVSGFSRKTVGATDLTPGPSPARRGEQTFLVHLCIYNAKGALMETLINKPMSPGTHSITWDARGVSAGVYLVRLQTGDQVFSRKVILLK
jgi:hypothetical protein